MISVGFLVESCAPVSVVFFFFFWVLGGQELPGSAVRIIKFKLSWSKNYSSKTVTQGEIVGTGHINILF